MYSRRGRFAKTFICFCAVIDGMKRLSVGSCGKTLNGKGEAMEKNDLTFTLSNEAKKIFAALSEIRAIEIEVFAMKAANSCRLAAGDSPAYGEKPFQEKSDAIRAIIKEKIDPSTYI
jgi:hypothetical protein